MYKLKTIILYLVLLCLTPIAQAEELIFQWQPPFDQLTNAIGKSPEAVLKQLKSNPPEKSQSNLFKAQYHGVLSEVFYSLSYPHEALEHAQIGLTLINGQSQPWLYHNLKLQEANAYDLVGSPSSGMKGANAAIVWAQLNDIPELLVDALFVRGSLRISLVDYTGALTDLQQAYDIAPDNGPGLSKGNVASMLALVYEYRQEDQLSIPFFQEAAQYSRENGETLELSIALYGLGRAYKNIGKTQEGRELLLESKQLAREVGDEQGVGYALKELAGIAIAEQRLETAETLLQEALGIFLTSQNRYLLVDCYRTLVILSIIQDQLEQGENYLNAAYQQIDPQTMPIQKLDLDEVKARFLAAKGKHKQAYDLLQTTVAPRQEYYSQQSTQQLHSLRSRYEIDVKERENELLAQQNRLQQENLKAAETQNLQLMLLFGATLIICALLVVMAYRTKQNRAQLESLANTDGLTGLANRRRCLELLDVQIQLSSRHQHGLSVAIVDIDFFKRINDQYGHQVGDKVLRAFGELCLKTFRSSDVVGRIGGEEFLIALPHTQLNDASNSLKSLSLKVKALSRELQVEGLVISISVGLAVLQKDMDQEAILLKCDEALYQAKHQGRDQICLAPLEEDSGYTLERLDVETEKSIVLKSSPPTEGFILNRTHVERQGKTYIEFWMTTDLGPVKLLTDAQESVFFIESRDEDRARKVLRHSQVLGQLRPLQLKSFEQCNVSGVYFQSVQQYYRAREVLKVAGIRCYEDDIRPADRYLMERFVYGSAAFVGVEAVNSPANWLNLSQGKLKPCEYHPNFKVLSIDIECSAQGQLFSIGLAADSLQQVLMIGRPQPGPEFIHWVADEKALLEQFVAQILEFDPDLIIGWNVINFDVRLLIERAKTCNVLLTLGRDGSEIRWRDARNESNQGFVDIAGRIVIDGIDALKTATYQFESFSLENVARALLGKGKQTQDPENRLAQIEHDFEHNKVALAEYNLQDCVLVLEIFAHTNIIDFLVLRSHLTGLELDRMGGSVAAFINLYLPKLHRAGYISPNRPVGGGLASPGGYVMDSQPGLYQNVLVLDFKSLYPSIIRTFKIDPLGLVEGLLSPENSIEGFRGAYFSRERHFLPDIITSLWQQRDEAKRNKDAARSQAIKILMNSFYGVLGSGGCPFYDTRLASSITLRGHQIMQKTAAFIEQAGYQVIYGDTDSTFVWLEGFDSRAEAFEVGQRLAQDINAMWQHNLEREYDLPCHLEIEFETLFETFLMPTIRGSEHGSKKRYAGLKHRPDQPPELVFKGLESVRSDWTELARDFQRKLYQKVFNHEDVTSYILGIVEGIHKQTFDDLLVYRKRLRQPLNRYTKNVPPHVKAARIADDYYAKQGKPLQYQNKGWIRYWVTLDGPQPIEYRTAALDYQHYVDKQIRPIAEGILPFIGVSFDELVSAQMGLF